MTTIPNNSLFETILQAYLGDAYANQTVGFLTQKDVLWNTFLSQNGLTANEATSITLSGNTSILQEFDKFIQQTAQTLQTTGLSSNGVIAGLSPQEMSSRQVMFSVYNLMVLMLETLQNNVSVTGQNISFLANFQNQYANLMGRLANAFYVGGSLSIPVINTGNTASWTLGYGGITMQDYLQTAISGVTPTSNSAATGPLTVSYPGASGSPVPALALGSLNIPSPPPPGYPPTGGTIGNNIAMVQDALTNVQQTSLIAAGPLTNTSYTNLLTGPNGAGNSMTFTSNSTSVTFTYTYMQQYVVRVTPYRLDSHGVPQPQSQQTVNSFYPVTVVSAPVTYDANATNDQKLKAVEAGYASFINSPTPLDNQSIVPPTGIPLASIPGGPYDGYTNPTSYTDTNTGLNASALHPTLTIYQSMTEPITFYNVSQVVTSTDFGIVGGLPNGTGPGNVTAIRSLAINRSTPSTYNAVSTGGQDYVNHDTSFNLPFTQATDQFINLAQSTASQHRANSNSLLQQFITNAQSQKQILTNTSDSESSNENQAQTGVSQATSVLNAVIDQMSTIMTSIFQIKR